MSFKRWGARRVCAFLLLCAATASGGTAVAAQGRAGQPQTPEVEMLAAVELKRKVDRNEPVTIIDVRASDTFINSDSKIKGALHVRPRRLQSRLAVSPLKDLPRDREVVTYCACPGDEASIRAAQTLLAAGFKRVRVLKGGWQAWLTARGPVEAKPRGT